jgi:hypothetical protein
MVDLKLNRVEEAEVPLEGLQENELVSLVFGAAGCVFLVLGAVAR